jgi:hypothetical protein
MEMNRYLIQKGVNMSLQSRARKYLEFALNESSNKLVSQNILKWLPETLKEEIIISTNMRIIKKIEFLSRLNFSQKF